MPDKQNKAALVGSHTRKNWFMVISLIACVGLILGGMGIAYFFLPANIHYHITERYFILSGDSDTAVHLGAMAPKSGPYQTVKNVKVDWNGEHKNVSHKFIDLHYFNDELKKGSESVAVISYDVTLPQAKVSWQEPVEQADIRAQTGIECDNPQLMAQASLITDGFSENKAFRIFDYTSDHLNYSTVDKELTSRSALTAYQFGDCACAGYARLMVALCRASGIPSRFVVGAVLPALDLIGSSQTYTSGHPGQAHAWVEYFSEDKWSLADPTLGSGPLNMLRFNRNDGQHLYYGEYDRLWAIYQDMFNWAQAVGQVIYPQEKSFKFVFSAGTQDVSVASEILVEKGWDGRWLNTFLVWGAMTILFCRLRNKFFSPP